MSVPLISIVVPCYNEEAVINATLSRILGVFSKIRRYRFELICVNDGSVDSTKEILQSQVALDERIKVITLTRNFGHQVAVSAGLARASGEAAIVIDADLQDPPELFDDFLSKWEQGYDVVYGVRANRLGESRFKKITAWLFYRILNNLTEIEIPKDAGDFRLISRRVIDAMNAFPEKSKYLRGLISWTGYSSVGVEYIRERRYAGTTKYPLKKMISLASQAIFSFSNKPLEIVITLGVTIAVASLAASAWFVVSKFGFGLAVPGWTGLIVAITFLGGVQILALGIVGNYVGRIFNEAKSRPLYIIDSEEGFER
jgi:dolichol-phosphate mannosyltransferase